MSARVPNSDLERTKRAQREAADPRASAWVSANAGTGKTHVLTLRALRLMLAGTIPERILCLTYTKAAAAEMSKRVYDTLADWVTMAEDELSAKLAELISQPPTREEIDRARTLFTMAIETPGGLKVQTIHSFCERLLQRFPLEAGVAPGFTILDEATADLLQREAIDAVLSVATARSLIARRLGARNGDPLCGGRALRRRAARGLAPAPVARRGRSAWADERRWRPSIAARLPCARALARLISRNSLPQACATQSFCACAMR